MGKSTIELLALLESNANADNAKAMSAYMKDRFPFYGIKKNQSEVPLTKRLY